MNNENKFAEKKLSNIFILNLVWKRKEKPHVPLGESLGANI